MRFRDTPNSAPTRMTSVTISAIVILGLCLAVPHFGPRNASMAMLSEAKEVRFTFTGEKTIAADSDRLCFEITNEAWNAPPGIKDLFYKCTRNKAGERSRSPDELWLKLTKKGYVVGGCVLADPERKPIDVAFELLIRASNRDLPSEVSIGFAVSYRFDDDAHKWSVISAPDPTAMSIRPGD